MCQGQSASEIISDAVMQDPSLEERQAALFNSTCVHAGNGDVEFAQVTLRGTVFARCSDTWYAKTVNLGLMHCTLLAMAPLTSDNLMS